MRSCRKGPDARVRMTKRCIVEQRCAGAHDQQLTSMNLLYGKNRVIIEWG